MPNSDSLATFGVILCIVVAAFLVVPILRGSRDIISAWNALLLGLIGFTGFGAIEVKYEDSLGFDSLNWFQPNAKEMSWCMWSSSVTVAALIIFYYRFNWAKRFGQRRLQRWPEFSAPLAFFVIGICFSFMAVSLIARQMAFVGPLSLNLALIGAPAACVFSFMLWNRSRVNIGWLALFVGVFAACAMYAMLISGGRRPLLSMFLAPVLCVYGMQARSWSRPKMFLVVGLAAIGVFSVGVVYSKFRWYSSVNQEKRTSAGIINQMKRVREGGNLFSALTKGGVGYVSQGNALFGMLTTRYVSQGALVPSPLNSLKVLATYPIPRKWWPDKPQAVGITVVRETSHILATNWGLGFSGQGAYEGGVAALILYAGLIVILIRVLDEPIKMQPDNPFLIFIYATVLPNVAGIPRGDMGLFTKEILQGVIFALILGYACRVVFGSKETSQPLGAIAAHPSNAGYPVLPSSYSNRY